MSSFLSSQQQLPPACSSAAPAATANPQWTLLAPYGGGAAEGCNITGDTKTIAAAATSNGHRISVSLRREPFSALSHICLRFQPGRANTPAAYSTVVAAHGGSVLVQISSTEAYNVKTHAVVDYFLYYNVGAAAAAAAANPARPPSLYRLPRFDSSTSSTEQWQRLDISATGLLCRGEAEFVVAELKMVWSEEDDAAAVAFCFRHIPFELRLFRHGKWSVKRPWIIHGHGRDGYKLQVEDLWDTIAVVPLNNGMLCWVDRHSGVIFSDVLDEGPNNLRFVPYPVGDAPTQTLRVHQRSRCIEVGQHGTPQLLPHCGCSEHAAAFDIWTLKADDMAWVLDTETNMVDSTELWVLPDVGGHARDHLIYPVATMNGGGHVAVSTNGGGGVNSEESAAPTMEGKGEHIGLCVSIPSATASLRDRLQGSNGATSASTGDHQQGDNGMATMDRWPKRRRRAN